MGDPFSVVLAGTAWLLKFSFLSGWYVTKWLVWLSWPLWAGAAGLGAFSALL